MKASVAPMAQAAMATSLDDRVRVALHQRPVGVRRRDRRRSRWRRRSAGRRRSRPRRATCRRSGSRRRRGRAGRTRVDRRDRRRRRRGRGCSSQAVEGAGGDGRRRGRCGSLRVGAGEQDRAARRPASRRRVAIGQARAAARRGDRLLEGAAERRQRSARLGAARCALDRGAPGRVAGRRLEPQVRVVGRRPVDHRVPGAGHVADALERRDRQVAVGRLRRLEDREHLARVVVVLVEDPVDLGQVDRLERPVRRVRHGRPDRRSADSSRRSPYVSGAPQWMW